MLKSLRRWCDRHTGIALLVGIAFLLTGIYLVIVTTRRTKAPDPARSEPRSATAFLASTHFAELSSQQRDEYLRALSLRYLASTTEQRRALDAGLSASGNDPALIRAGGRELGLAMARSSIEGYDQLTPEQRQQRIAALRMFAHAMGFRTGVAAALDPTSQPVADATGTTGSFREGLARFQRDLLDSFSAEQRTTLGRMASDIHHSAPKK